jgi:hypothetical protein
VVFVDKDLARAIYDLGHTLIQDDKADLGYTTYRNRTNHRYHGKLAPHHPSPFHHWQAGTLLCLVGQLMSLGALYQDVYDTSDEDETVNT